MRIASPLRSISISAKAGLAMLAALAMAIFVICLTIPACPQPLSYHLFADQRSFLGISNFCDVASNLPFAIVGVWGLLFLHRSRLNTKAFSDQRERVPYGFVFAGLLLTAFGSSYYHLSPDNARLVWDRLPMTITFMSMIAAVITERIHVRLGLSLLPVLLVVGAASVLLWYQSETRGAGDLRFYAALQAYSALVILLALLLPGRYTRGSDLGFVFGFYALAKVFELFDVPIFKSLRLVSGHTLKHIAAAAAGFFILQMLRMRTPVAAISSTADSELKSVPANSLCALMVRNDHA